MILRRGTPEDADALAAMLADLSPASGFHRFLGGLGRPSPALVRALLGTRPDTGSGAARGSWLAVDRDEFGERLVGHACWYVDAAGVCDVGVVVHDGWQRRGLGRRLLEAAVTEAATAGATGVHLDVHPDNRLVLRILRDRLPRAALGFTDGLVTADLPLARVLRAAAAAAPAAGSAAGSAPASAPALAPAPSELATAS